MPGSRTGIGTSGLTPPTPVAIVAPRSPPKPPPCPSLRGVTSDSVSSAPVRTPVILLLDWTNVDWLFASAVIQNIMLVEMQLRCPLEQWSQCKELVMKAPVSMSSHCIVARWTGEFTSRPAGLLLSNLWLGKGHLLAASEAGVPVVLNSGGFWNAPPSWDWQQFVIDHQDAGGVTMCKNSFYLALCLPIELQEVPPAVTRDANMVLAHSHTNSSFVHAAVQQFFSSPALCNLHTPSSLMCHGRGLLPADLGLNALVAAPSWTVRKGF